MEDLQTSADYTVLYSALFGSVWMNYWYTSFLQSGMSFLSQAIIGLSDRVGIEVHFVRFVNHAIFDTNVSINRVKDMATDPYKFFSDPEIIIDAIWMFLVILPSFILMLRFLSYPPDKRYTSKLNCLIAPICLLPLFRFNSWDVCYLSVISAIGNFYCFYYMVEQDDYESYSDRRQ